MEIFAKNIKSGDLVNCHCDGWCRVENVVYQYNAFYKKRCTGVIVKFSGREAVNYLPEKKIFVVRQ